MKIADNIPQIPDDFIIKVANKHNVSKTELEALLLALKTTLVQKLPRNSIFLNRR